MKWLNHCNYHLLYSDETDLQYCTVVHHELTLITKLQIFQNITNQNVQYKCSFLYVSLFGVNVKTWLSVWLKHFLQVNDFALQSLGIKHMIPNVSKLSIKQSHLQIIICFLPQNEIF